VPRDGKAHVTAYGFDLDGTLDRPGIAQLASDLFDAGHEVWVITGGLADAGEWTMQAREQKLASLGVRYTGIVRCIDPDVRRIGALKGEQCTRLGVVVMLDNDRPYLNGMAATSDSARVWVL